MPVPHVLRPVLVLGVLAVLAACAKEPQSATKTAATPPPATLKTADATEATRLKLSREAQLQTPLDLRPEATGAPSPDFYANGSDIDAAALLAGGVDIEPETRVWQRWPAGTRQIYGPAPSAADPIFAPVVVYPE